MGNLLLVWPIKDLNLEHWSRDSFSKTGRQKKQTSMSSRAMRPLCLAYPSQTTFYFQPFSIRVWPIWIFWIQFVPVGPFLLWFLHERVFFLLTSLLTNIYDFCIDNIINLPLAFRISIYYGLIRLNWKNCLHRS